MYGKKLTQEDLRGYPFDAEFVAWALKVQDDPQHKLMLTRVIHIIRNHGWTGLSDFAARSDAELLALPRFGPSCLAYVREHSAQFEPRPTAGR